MAEMDGPWVPPIPEDAAEQEVATEYPREQTHWNPQNPYHLTADQQIRAKALECVVLSLPNDKKVGYEAFDEALEKFERYIRGK